MIAFTGDADKHVFSCFNATQVQNWVVALRQARYFHQNKSSPNSYKCFYLHSIEHLRLQLKILESKLESLGGKVTKVIKVVLSRDKLVFFQSISMWNKSVPVRPAPPLPEKSIGPSSSSFRSHLATGAPSGSSDQDLIIW